SFKVSRVWADAQSRFWDLNGLRHILEPSLDYVYVPAPSTLPSGLPQFDYQGPSLWQVPIEYPEYNSIDSIDSQNVLRFGLQNTLQTKRSGQVVDFINWNVQTDWRLHPNAGQTTFSDIYSDFRTRPRPWLTLESLNRYDIHGKSWRMALESLTIQPNNVWSWSGGYFYLNNDYGTSPTALGQGENSFMSSIYYRLNENWGFRATHRFDARAGRLQEQAYTVYRDLRSWTGALTFRLLDNDTGSEDFAVAFTFSLKAAPRHSPGTDKAKTASLLGG
ncbi:MAG TPA: LPS assembly protein LptD, partial [Verrucomicrobiae bacterium]|nr:LPS assembly protein LptD [Verrucomicrobiae bacterium]